MTPSSRYFCYNNDFLKFASHEKHRQSLTSKSYQRSTSKSMQSEKKFDSGASID